jgi:hypothetical protein
MKLKILGSFLIIVLIGACSDGGPSIEGSDSGGGTGLDAMTQPLDDAGNPLPIDSGLPQDDQTTVPPVDTNPLTCGNGTIDTGEACDGNELNGMNCESLGYTGGQLKCGSGCAFDETGCSGGTSFQQFGEKCGGSHGSCLAGLTCVLFNQSGTQEGYCTQECSDTAPCPSSPVGAECAFQLTSSGKTICGFLCSASNPTCPSGLNCNYNQSGGFYYCTTDSAAVCGNNTIEFQEVCDGTDLNNASCQMLGYSGGTLKCNSSCQLDMSGCTGQSTCTNLPAMDCTDGNSTCTALELFNPTVGDGYLVTHPPVYSWLRHDTAMLVKYATAAVACLMPGSYPLGLGDMSEQTGDVPGTAAGQLRHPAGTHVQGLDIDIAYYQVNQPNNYLRPICDHYSGGQDQYHCVSAPTFLDVPRTTLFLAKLMESSRIRVIGVDGTVGTLVEAEAQNLHTQGKISTSSLNAIKGGKLAYETTDGGAGWFRFHHHHNHLSTLSTSYVAPPTDPPFGNNFGAKMECMTDDCNVEAHENFYQSVMLFGAPKFQVAEMPHEWIHPRKGKSPSKY